MLVVVQAKKKIVCVMLDNKILKAHMNFNEGLKRVSAVFFGLLGLAGVFFGIFVFFIEPISRMYAVLVVIISPVAAYFFHKIICHVVEWVVDGFKLK